MIKVWIFFFNNFSFSFDRQKARLMFKPTDFMFQCFLHCWRTHKYYANIFNADNLFVLIKHILIFSNQCFYHLILFKVFSRRNEMQTSSLFSFLVGILVESFAIKKYLWDDMLKLKNSYRDLISVAIYSFGRLKNIQKA